jgi:hypothetical protein
MLTSSIPYPILAVGQPARLLSSTGPGSARVGWDCEILERLADRDAFWRHLQAKLSPRSRGDSVAAKGPSAADALTPVLSFPTTEIWAPIPSGRARAEDQAGMTATLLAFTAVVLATGILIVVLPPGDTGAITLPAWPKRHSWAHRWEVTNAKPWTAKTGIGKSETSKGTNKRHRPRSARKH